MNYPGDTKTHCPHGNQLSQNLSFVNKLASSKLRQSETITHSLTWVRCRATSVAKNGFKQISFQQHQTLLLVRIYVYPYFSGRDKTPIWFMYITNAVQLLMVGCQTIILSSQGGSSCPLISATPQIFHEQLLEVKSFFASPSS